MIVPEDHVRQVEKVSQNLFICPPHASQITALAALDAKEELDQNVNVYKKNREILLEELPKAGFETFSPPDGAFYIYVCLLYTSPSPRDLSTSRMPSSA